VIAAWNFTAKIAKEIAKTAKKPYLWELTTES